MEKKFSYSKPFMVMERFTPQVFCSGCSLVIDSVVSSTVAGLLRIDWNDNTIMNANERWNEDHHAGANGAELTKWEVLPHQVYKLIEPDYGNLGDKEHGISYVDGGSIKEGFFTTNVRYEPVEGTLVRNTYVQNGSYYLLTGNGSGSGSNYHMTQS